MSLISKIANAYVGTRFLVATLSTPLTYSAVASPAIVIAQEKKEEQETPEDKETLKNLPYYRQSLGVGKRVYIGQGEHEETAHVVPTKDGFV